MYVTHHSGTILGFCYWDRKYLCVLSSKKSSNDKILIKKRMYKLSPDVINHTPEEKATFNQDSSNFCYSTCA